MVAKWETLWLLPSRHTSHFQYSARQKKTTIEWLSPLLCLSLFRPESTFAWLPLCFQQDQTLATKSRSRQQQCPWLMQGHYHSLTPNPTTRASPPATMTFRKRIFSLFSCLCHGKRGNRGNVEMKGRENHFFRFTSLAARVYRTESSSFHVHHHQYASRSNRWFWECVRNVSSCLKTMTHFILAVDAHVILKRRSRVRVRAA